MMVAYTKGLHEVAHGVWAWLAPDGSWGYSNAGLVCGDNESFLVDTLFDYRMTREMLASMEPITDTVPLAGALNTHANGDHCYGNALLDETVTIYATAPTAHEIHDVPPALFDEFVQQDYGPVLTPYMRDCFGAFEFNGIQQRDPDITFNEQMTLDIGGREIQLIELGPAHTDGDSVAFVPDDSVLFSGDLLFIGGTPISWSGAVDRWIDACERMLRWEPRVVVPGHGPVTDVSGIAAVRDYLAYVLDYAETALSSGVPWLDAAERIDLGPFTTLPQAERIVITLYHVYRRLEPATPELTFIELFEHMARWRLGRG